MMHVNAMMDESPCLLHCSFPASIARACGETIESITTMTPNLGLALLTDTLQMMFLGYLPTAPAVGVRP